MKRFTILIAVLTATGCRALPSGEFVDPVPTMDPNALEEAAIIAEAKAEMYHRLSERAAGFWRGAAQTASEGLGALGAPAALTGLLGAAGGFLVPTPGQRRRERVAKAEGEAEVSRRSPSPAAGAAPGEA
ncbi:MAG: hypothetical protein CME87_25815 [Herbaspirillum sp.]|nr:hypothetical protein [Herbaspirillum sp.]|tara:strand:+ start:6313 stop:6702 length:390 start_codon:yes stop_codon:yes gene_type:complete